MQFDREVAPERIVHARGMTAFGTFEVTHDISNLTSTAFLNGVGSKVCENQHALLENISAWTLYGPLAAEGLRDTLQRQLWPAAFDGCT